MLLEPEKAARYLHVYKEMLTHVSGRLLNSVEDYVTARAQLFSSGQLDAPPANDPALLAALRTAVYGKFVVGRHQKTFTELIGPNDQVYRVKGIATELSALMEPWTMVETAVMQFEDEWLCDGLVTHYAVQIGASLRRDLRAHLDATAEDTKKAKPRTTPGKPTPLQGQYLAFIYYFTKVNGLPPSEADMQRYFAVSAPTVHQMVKNLARAGLIEKAPRQARSIRVLVPRSELPDLE